MTGDLSVAMVADSLIVNAFAVAADTAWVRLTVTDIDGRRVTFEIEVRDALDTVGRARHVRFVVDLARQKERLEAKAAQVAEAAKAAKTAKT